MDSLDHLPGSLQQMSDLLNESGHGFDLLEQSPLLAQFELETDRKRKKELLLRKTKLLRKRNVNY